MCFLPREAEPARAAVRRDRGDRGGRGPARARLARRAGGRGACGTRRARLRPARSRSSSSGAGDGVADQDAFERKLYVIRRVVGARGRSTEPADRELLLADDRLQGDAHRPAAPALLPRPARPARYVSRLALVHSRFSTNTFPSWELAHPYRMLAHNGEINTLRGNRNWMRARELHAGLAAVRRRRGQDPAAAARRHLRLGLARRPARAARARRPLARPRDLDADPGGLTGGPSCPRRCATSTPTTRSLVEPWDGPAAVAFTDGRVIGATLDRNGLRPGRWLVTQRRLGGARLRDGRARRPAGRDRGAKGRLLPGKLFLVDLEARPDRARRGDQARPGAPPALRRVAARARRRTSRTCPRPQPARAARGAAAGQASSPSAGPRRTCG